MGDVNEPFRLPSKAELDGIAHDLKLGAVQRHELDLCLRHVHADLEGFFRTRIDRSHRREMVLKLKDFGHALDRLIKAMESDVEGLNEVLPFKAREAIGKATSDALIKAITGRDVSPAGTRLEYAEDAEGLKSGAYLMLAYLRLVKSPIDDWLQEYKPDPGGPTPDLVRQELIEALKEAAPDIIGRRATGTTRGKFVKLVTGVFHTLGLSDDGLEKMIERILYPPKAKRRRSPKPVAEAGRS